MNIFDVISTNKIEMANIYNIDNSNIRVKNLLKAKNIKKLVKFKKPYFFKAKKYLLFSFFYFKSQLAFI